MYKLKWKILVKYEWCNFWSILLNNDMDELQTHPHSACLVTSFRIDCEIGLGIEILWIVCPLDGAVAFGRKQNTPKWLVDIDRDTCVFSKQILLKGIYNILKLSSLFILFIHYKQQYDTKNDIVFVLTALEIVGC